MQKAIWNFAFVVAQQKKYAEKVYVYVCRMKEKEREIKRPSKNKCQIVESLAAWKVVGLADLKFCFITMALICWCAFGSWNA